MTRKGEKMWFPCSFGKTQKHHILVLLTHLFNELEKKAIPSSKAACNVQLFPCSQSSARQTFWIYCAGTAALSECPDTRQPFPQQWHGNEKTATEIWACRKTSLKASYLQLHFQQPFWSRKVSIHILYNQFSSNFLLLQTIFFYYFLLYCSPSLLSHTCLSIPFPDIKQLIENLW